LSRVPAAGAGPVLLAALIRATFLAAGWLASTAVLADDTEGEDGLEHRDAHARLSFERIQMPGDERVGLVGSTYLVGVKDSGGWAVGPGVYGAVTGRRGGFFAFGAEAAWHRRLIGPLGVELGMFAGGGGGGGAPQGGGLMLRPHADLLWEQASYAVGLTVAKVKFPSGSIDSTQWGLVLETTTDFAFVPALHLDTPVLASGRTGLGFDRFQLVGAVYRDRSGVTLLDGSAEPRQIATVGARAEQALGKNVYWGLEASGAAQSRVAGYAELLGAVGLEGEAVPKRLSVGARVALGMAGGGGIRVGGGLLAKTAVYGIARLGDDVGVSLEAGFASAPRGEFRAASLSAAMVWTLDSPHGGDAPALPVRTDFSAGIEQYKAARHDGSASVLRADVLEVDRFLSPNFYVSGQVHSAISGGAGGYSAALIGAGWVQPLASRWHVGAEFLAGASGGGGVDSHGSMVQPMVYAGYQLSPAVALRVDGGRVKALRGPLDANVVGVLLTATYGVSGSD
jgi:hypothetical protein